MINKKSKGTNAERELIHLFWQSGWAAFRAAGSGSMRYPCPDIIAGNNVKKFAIECKTSADTKKYLTKDEINDLKKFSTMFGAQAWVGVRFNNLEWFFLTLEDLEETENSFAVSIELAKRKGLTFNQLIEY